MTPVLPSTVIKLGWRASLKLFSIQLLDSLYQRVLGLLSRWRWGIRTPSPITWPSPESSQPSPLREGMLYEDTSRDVYIKLLKELRGGSVITTDSEERKNAPVYSGVMAYFPLAMVEIARLSKVGNDKHNPGEPLHWARGKSMDHADCIARHLLEHGKLDDDGMSHTVKVAWRALALLQEELEQRAV